MSDDRIAMTERLQAGTCRINDCPAEISWVADRFLWACCMPTLPQMPAWMMNSNASLGDLADIALRHIADARRSGTPMARLRGQTE